MLLRVAIANYFWFNINIHQRASLVAHMVKNLSAMWETWVWSLGWEDPLEKGTATHFNILARSEEPGGLQSMDCKELDMTSVQLLSHVRLLVTPWTAWGSHQASLSITNSRIIVCKLFDDGHSDWCKVIPHCSFYLHFYNATPGLPGHHQHQTHFHCVSDAIQPSHPLSPSSPPAFNLSQHQDLFKWVSSSQVAKVLEFWLQHQSFQWTLRTDLL